jgi:hypothetical protein
MAGRTWHHVHSLPCAASHWMRLTSNVRSLAVGTSARTVVNASAKMFDLKTSLNSAGLVLTLVGVYVVYVNSPLNEHVIDDGNASTDDGKIAHRMRWRNRLMKYGVYTVLAGSVLQLASNYAPA